MKSYIHVNQHKIRSNRKTGSKEPVITVRNYLGNRYAKEVRIMGPCKIVYRPEKPLSCGAQVWIETEELVEIID